jgi:hypothetical protein
MNQPKYDFQTNESFLDYEFESDGPNGKQKAWLPKKNSATIGKQLITAHRQSVGLPFFIASP